MITVLPEGGLCNRMRAVASAWRLAQDTAQPLKVLWYRTPDFNARFDAIFDMAALPFSVHEVEAMHKVARLGFRVREVACRLQGQLVFSGERAGHLAFSPKGSQAALIGRDSFIRTHSRLVATEGLFQCFRPGAAVRAALNPLLPRLAGSVSVHIRRTDNVQAIAQSPLSAFVSLMQDALAEAPDSSFFVATDSPATLAELQSQFGNLVWQYDKRAYQRDDPAAIVDAAVDLFALAQGRRLIGSHWSSFTDTAAELRGIPCQIARKAS